MVQPPLLLRTFCGMVGQAAYGSAWREDDLSSLSLRLDHRPSDDPTVRQWFVAEQVLLALQSDVIRAGFRRDPGTNAIPDIEAKKIEEKAKRPRFFEDLNDKSDDLEDLDPLDDPSICLVHRDYWSDSSHFITANLHLSYCQVPARYIYALSSNLSYEPLRGRDEAGAAPEDYAGGIFIIQPLRAIRRMYSYLSLPEPEWFMRYRSYRNRLVDEIVAAAWRYIAISGLKKQHGCNEQIMAAMREYLRKQGLTQTPGLSDKLLGVLVGKIVHQWGAEDLESLVILNSTPEARKPGRPSKS